MIRWNESMEATTLSWVERHALRCARRARGEDQLEDLVRGGVRPRGLAGLPVGREGRVVGCGLRAERLHGRGREAVEAGLARVGGVAAGAQDEVAGSGRLDDPLDRRGRHPQVERHQHEARGHRAVVGGRELGRGGRPGQDPVAGFQVQGSQPPGSDPGAAVEFAEAPVDGRAVVEPKSERMPVAIARDRRIEKVQERRHRGRRVACRCRAPRAAAPAAADTCRIRGG